MRIGASASTVLVNPSTRRWRSTTILVTFSIYTFARYTSATMSEPINKKRKLQVNGSNGLVKQESFSDILMQLEAEEDASGGEILVLELL